MSQHMLHPHARLATSRLEFARSRRACPPLRRSRAPLAARSQQDGQEPDLVERLVGRLFGQKALADEQPFGLKRMSAEDFPEIYPATTTEFAAPVEGDSPAVAAFRPLLAKTQLERKPLR